MRRDLNELGGVEHDVLVIGGGIQGACIAWDAALRGLKVALVERDDFGAATSANSHRHIDPSRQSVRLAARIVGDALGWDEGRRAAEEASVVRAGAV